MEQIQAWRTTDGKEFFDEAEAAQHEASSVNRRMAEEFADSVNIESKNSRTRTINTIVQFMYWWQTQADEKKTVAVPKGNGEDHQGEDVPVGGIGPVSFGGTS